MSSSKKIFKFLNCWKVRATKASQLSRVLGGAKGVMVPHQMVKTVGDIMIISRTAVPQQDEELDEDFN